MNVFTIIKYVFTISSPKESLPLQSEIQDDKSRVKDYRIKKKLKINCEAIDNHYR